MMKKSLRVITLTLILALIGIPGLASAQVRASVAMGSYTDISGHWAEKAINTYADPVVFADMEGRFLPQQPIARSEFVWMIHKTLGVNMQYFKATDIKDYFTDVSNNDLIASKLYDLATMDIIDYRGVFGPKATLPREEMVNFIMNGLEYRLGGKLPTNPIVSTVFRDEGLISEQYKKDIAFAASLSLINGRGNGLFAPKADCSRAEAAMMMQRLTDAANRFSGNVDVLVTAVPEADRITMNLVITNNSSNPVILDYTSGQRYDVALLDNSKNTLYRWSADKLFIQELSSIQIEPGQSLGYSDELRGDAYISIKDKISFMTVFITGQSKSFLIDSNGYQIQVK